MCGQINGKQLWGGAGSFVSAYKFQLCSILIGHASVSLLLRPLKGGGAALKSRTPDPTSPLFSGLGSPMLDMPGFFLGVPLG
jgi:hypothetical protein